jgi:hypothetical protein
VIVVAPTITLVACGGSDGRVDVTATVPFAATSTPTDTATSTPTDTPTDTPAAPATSDGSTPDSTLGGAVDGALGGVVGDDELRELEAQLDEIDALLTDIELEFGQD